MGGNLVNGRTCLGSSLTAWMRRADMWNRVGWSLCVMFWNGWQTGSTEEGVGYLWGGIGEGRRGDDVLLCLPLF